MLCNSPAFATSIDEVLRIRAETTPDDLSACFLIDGEEEGPRLSYANLDKKARALAALLRDRGGRAIAICCCSRPDWSSFLLFSAAFMPAWFPCRYRRRVRNRWHRVGKGWPM